MFNLFPSANASKTKLSTLPLQVTVAGSFAVTVVVVTVVAVVVPMQDGVAAFQTPSKVQIAMAAPDRTKPFLHSNSLIAPAAVPCPLNQNQYAALYRSTHEPSRGSRMVQHFSFTCSFKCSVNVAVKSWRAHLPFLVTTYGLERDLRKNIYGGILVRDGSHDLSIRAHVVTYR